MVEFANIINLNLMLDKTKIHIHMFVPWCKMVDMQYVKLAMEVTTFKYLKKKLILKIFKLFSYSIPCWWVWWMSLLMWKWNECWTKHLMMHLKGFFKSIKKWRFCETKCSLLGVGTTKIYCQKIVSWLWKHHKYWPIN